jgi:hypothetical protein
LECDLTHERLKEVLNYIPIWGIFIWKISTSNRVAAGSIAGCLTSHEYTKISIDGKKYYAHRLAVFYMTGEWPIEHVDHKNRARSNNKWENIRNATPSQNHGNLEKHIDNTSGIKGVWWNRFRSKWISQITVQGKRTCLGSFDTKEEAAEAYAKAANEKFKEFARI